MDCIYSQPGSLAFAYIIKFKIFPSYMKSLGNQSLFSVNHCKSRDTRISVTFGLIYDLI